MLLNLAALCFVLVASQAKKVEKLTEDVIRVFLKEHNVARAAVGVPPLIWDKDLSDSAADFAVKCTDTEGSGYKGVGENQFSFSDSLCDNSVIAETAVKGLVSDKKYVDLPDWTCLIRGENNCGTYSQIVWKSTRKVGCAIVHCDTRALANNVVCLYSPPGNYIGQKPF